MGAESLTPKNWSSETLASIAERKYGDRGKWDVILDRNKSRFTDGDPGAIYAGMELDIPEI